MERKRTRAMEKNAVVSEKAVNTEAILTDRQLLWVKLLTPLGIILFMIGLAGLLVLMGEFPPDARKGLSKG